MAQRVGILALAFTLGLGWVSRSVPTASFAVDRRPTSPVGGPGPAAAGAASPPHILVIAIDAVPFALAAKLTAPALGEEGLLAGFKGPVPLISTFPSDTNVALPGILRPFGVGLSPGYEARFYDRGRNRIRGGGPVSYHRITFPWREFFDWRVPGITRRALVGLRPLGASLGAIDRSLEASVRSDASPYFTYYAETDLLGHLKGPGAYEAVLRRLDARLRRLRRRHPDRSFHTVIFSDHGMAGGEPLRNIRDEVEATVRHHGYRQADRLVHQHDVVLVPFGLVSSLVAHCAPAEEPAVAAALASIEGIDLCVAPTADGWRVESSRGSAHIRQHGGASGELWSYEPLSGDPLQLAPTRQTLQVRCPACDGFFPDGWWLEATREGEYPDALYRIRGTFELVENPASVVCSVAAGYVYGGAMAGFALRLTYGRLRWTHGALSRQASLGFLMTDVPGWQPPAAARFDQALAWLAEGER